MKPSHLLWTGVAAVAFVLACGGGRVDDATDGATPPASTPEDGVDGFGAEYITFAGVQVDPTCTYVADELAVKLQEGAEPEVILDLLAAFDARRIKELVDLDGGWIVEVDPAERESLLRALREQAGVERVEMIGFTHRPGSDPQGFNPCGTPVAEPDTP